MIVNNDNGTQETLAAMLEESEDVTNVEIDQNDEEETFDQLNEFEENEERSP